MKRPSSLATIIVLLAGLAHAEGADTSSWTKEEFLAAYPQITPEIFEQIDLNDDGIIDPDEFLLAIDAGLISPLGG
ncbi:MAG: hypothetical protein ACXIU7_12845 [Roseinatronobacter sp.]